MVMVHGLRLACGGNGHLQHPHEDHPGLTGAALPKSKPSGKSDASRPKAMSTAQRLATPTAIRATSPAPGRTTRRAGLAMNLMATDYCLT